MKTNKKSSLKLSAGAGYNATACAFRVADTFRFRSWVPCRYEAETIQYAIYRFLRRDGALRSKLLRESYRLRLANGRGRRPVRHSLLLPASRLELPGAWTQVFLTVAPEGVTAEGLNLLTKAPSPRQGRRGASSPEQSVA